MTRKITLRAYLEPVAPETEALILHHMGANCYEAVASGTVEEIRSSRCVEVCGNHPVEKVTVDVEGYPWDTSPTLIITIGKEAAT